MLYKYWLSQISSAGSLWGKVSVKKGKKKSNEKALAISLFFTNKG